MNRLFAALIASGLCSSAFAQAPSQVAAPLKSSIAQQVRPRAPSRRNVKAYDFYPAQLAAEKLRERRASNQNPAPPGGRIASPVKESFRSAVRSSPALRWDHAKRVAKVVATSVGKAAVVGTISGAATTLGAGLLLTPAAGLFVGPPVALATAGSTLYDKLREGLGRAREATAKEAVADHVVSPEKVAEWKQAGLFYRGEQ